MSPLPFASSAWNAPAFDGTPHVPDITLVAPVHPAASVSKPWKKVEVARPAAPKIRPAASKHTFVLARFPVTTITDDDWRRAD